MLKTLITLCRKIAGDAHEALDNATVVEQFEQGVRDAESHIAKADMQRINCRAELNGLKRKLDDEQASFDKWTKTAKQFKEAGDMESAAQAIEKRRVVEQNINGLKTQIETFEAQIKTIDKVVSEKKIEVDRLRNQIALVKTNEASLKLQETTASAIGGGNGATQSAQASLDKINQMHAKRRDRLNAINDLTVNDDLHAKAAQLEAKTSIDDELAKL